MTIQSTIDKLIEMRLTAMADAFILQKDDPKMKDVLLKTALPCWWMPSTTGASPTA